MTMTTMKIQVLSDLHNEFLRHSTQLLDMSVEAEKQRSIRQKIMGLDEHWTPVDTISDTDADVIVLAGDIDTGVNGVEWAITESMVHSKPIIYVSGNHEFYGHEYATLRAQMKDAAAGTNVHVLENDQVMIAGVRFLGCTFWTDYRASDEYSLDETMAYVGSGLNDHRRIAYEKRKFLPSDALNLHQASRSWLENELTKNSDEPTVVITHHGPSKICQHKDFDLSPMSGGFWSNANELVEKADLWIFGHTHQCENIVVGGTPVVSNQRGYPGECVSGFSSTYVVEI